MVYLARLAPSGRRSQLHALTTIAGLLSKGQHDARSFPWHELQYIHTQALRTLLAERYAPATVNRMLASVLRECFYLGLMTADERERASTLPAVRSSTLPCGRALPNPEIRAMFLSCLADHRPEGMRDAALSRVVEWTAFLQECLF